MLILDGQRLSNSFNQKLKDSIEEFKKAHSVTPGLAVVLIGDNPASQVYVNQKIKRCSEIGFHSVLKKFEASILKEDLKKQIEILNKDSKIHGFLVQLPLPKHLSKEEILSWIDPKKDADGLTVENIGLLWSNKPRVVPCTALGVMELLKHYKIPIEGKQALVVGRSQIVGLPVAQQLLSHQATVTIAHSKTQNLKEQSLKADIIVVCAGQHALLDKSYFKKGATVVDVGIHRLTKDGKTYLEGDVNAKDLDGHLKALSPVPKGVGPMTIAMLLQNTFHLAKLSLKTL